MKPIKPNINSKRLNYNTIHISYIYTKANIYKIKRKNNESININARLLY